MKSLLRFRFPWRVFSRLVLVQALLILMALGASGFAARYFFKQQFLSQAESQLRDTLTVLARDLPSTIDAAWCGAHAKGTQFRFTVLSDSGVVLCDSHHAPETMESHAQRPEVVSARERGFGAGIRYSETLRESMLYEALQVPDRRLLLRGAVPLEKFLETVRVFDLSLTLILGVVALLLGIFAVWTGVIFLVPLGRMLAKAQTILNPEEQNARGARIAESGLAAYGEWSDFEVSLESIRRDLSSKVQSLRIQREEQATLMGAITDAILAVDSTGRPLFYNRLFRLMFRCAETEEPRLLWELFREPEILDVFRNALKQGRQGRINAIRLEQGANPGKYFSVSVAPLRRESGEVYGAIGIFHDVSELKAAEQIRIDFVANVSHELRTPLTAIKGYSDTLAQDLAEGRMPEPQFVEAILRNTRRLMSLIQDLLDLSSLESTEALQRTRLSAEEHTGRVVQQMRDVFEKKEQKVECSFEAGSVSADPRRLEQVLVNLLDNASKYTPPGGTIAIRWEHSAAAGSGPPGMLLRVSDTGPGIPPEHHSRLFERFYRVDKARSRDVGGTGLGLAIVKHIMQRHGGDVWVESAPGLGSTFICRFPDA